MTEKVQDILRKGFGMWKNNLILSVPFVLSIVIIFMTFIVFAIILLFLLLPGLASGTITPGSIGIANIAILTLAALILILVISFISSFFSAGAIGMSKKAVEQKKPNLDEMVDYGRRKFIDLFLSSVIILLVMLVLGLMLFGIFFGVPIAIGLSPSGSPIMLVWVVVGVIVSAISFFAIALALAMAPYSIVISDLGAVEGIKSGVDFFLKNKADTFILWLIVLVISIASSLIFNFVQFIAELIPVLGIILSLLISLLSVAFSTLVLSPLSTVWFSYFYVDRTGN